MSTRMLAAVCSVLFLAIFWPSYSGAASDLEEGVNELAQQISLSMTNANIKKIAIVEFSDLDGGVSSFGQFLAEELTTQIFVVSPGQFEVVERRQLVRVLHEQKLTGRQKVGAVPDQNPEADSDLELPSDAKPVRASKSFFPVVSSPVRATRQRAAPRSSGQERRATVHRRRFRQRARRSVV